MSSGGPRAHDQPVGYSVNFSSSRSPGTLEASTKKWRRMQKVQTGSEALVERAISSSARIRRFWTSDEVALVYRGSFRGGSSPVVRGDAHLTIAGLARNLRCCSWRPARRLASINSELLPTSSSFSLHNSHKEDGDVADTLRTSKCGVPAVVSGSGFTLNSGGPVAFEEPPTAARICGV